MHTRYYHIQVAKYAGVSAQELDRMPAYWRDRYYLAFGAEQDAQNKTKELQARADAFNAAHRG